MTYDLRRLRLKGIVASAQIALADMAHVYEFPLTLEHPAVDGDANLVADEDATIWKLGEGDGAANLRYDLEQLGVNPAAYDELHIDFKPRGSLVMFEPQLSAFPVKGLGQNWFSKIPLVMDEWTTARFDLALGDDPFLRFARDPHDPVLQQQHLNIRLVKRVAGVSNEASWREVAIRGIRLLRRSVSVRFEETDAVLEQDGGTLRWVYTLRVRNEESRPKTARLWLETGGLDKFSADWVAKELTLEPREEIAVPLRLAISAAARADVPELYSERVQVFVQGDGGGPPVTSIMGYRPRFLWATVPLDGDLVRHRVAAAYQAKLPPAEAERAAMLQRAEKALGEAWGVPLHGPPIHPERYHNPETSSDPIPLTWFQHRDRRTEEILTDERYVRSYINRSGRTVTAAGIAADAELTVERLPEARSGVGNPPALRK